MRLPSANAWKRARQIHTAKAWALLVLILMIAGGLSNTLRKWLGVSGEWIWVGCLLATIFAIASTRITKGRRCDKEREKAWIFRRGSLERRASEEEWAKQDRHKESELRKKLSDKAKARRDSRSI